MQGTNKLAEIGLKLNRTEVRLRDKSTLCFDQFREV